MAKGKKNSKRSSSVNKIGTMMYMTMSEMNNSKIGYNQYKSFERRLKEGKFVFDKSGSGLIGQITGRRYDLTGVDKVTLFGNKLDIEPFLIAFVRVYCNSILHKYASFGADLDRIVDQYYNGTYVDLVDNIVMKAARRKGSKLNSDEYKLCRAFIAYDVSNSKSDWAAYSFTDSLLEMEDKLPLYVLMLNYAVMLLTTTPSKEKLNKDGVLEMLYKDMEKAGYNRYEKSSRNFDFSAGVLYWVVVKWAIDLVSDKFSDELKKYDKQADFISWYSEIDAEEEIRKCCKRSQSPFLYYMSGKITVDELLELREKEYKTRKSDKLLDIYTSLGIKIDSKVKSELGTGFNKDFTFDDMLEFITDIADGNEIYNTAIMANESGFVEAFNYIVTCGGNLKGDEAGLSKSVEYVKQKKLEVETVVNKQRSLERALSKREKKIEEHEKTIKKLESTISDLKRAKMVSEETAKKVESLQRSLKDADNKLNESNNKIANTSKKLEEANERYKSTLEKLRKMESYFGKYEDVEESFNEAKKLEEQADEKPEISFEEKLDAIRELSILICGGTLELTRGMEDYGLNISSAHRLSDNAFTKSVDVIIIAADQCSHKLMFKGKKVAANIGAMSLYFSGSNKKNLVNLIYEKINK